MIQTFMSHFNMTTLEIHNLDQSVALSVLAKGLLKNDLKKSFAKTYPQDFVGMLAQVERYA